MDMETTVTTLLRDFPRIRRAALAGETVIIKSREGNFRFTLDKPVSGGLLGCMQGRLRESADDLDQPTTDDTLWNSSL
jgi:hypothetical protein